MSDPAFEVLIEVEEAMGDIASAELFSLGATAIEVRDREGLKLPNVILPPEGKTWIIAGFVASDAQVLEETIKEALADMSWKTTRLEVKLRDDTDWATKWKEFFHPIRIGHRLWVAPSWEKPTRFEGDIVITLDPQMAFGTGQHATTRLCLQFLEKFADAHGLSDKRVLDVGTGSGILAIGAALLGAHDVVGVDNDEVSVDTAKENARINQAEHIDFRLGELPAAAPSGVFDLILANVLMEPLISMAEVLTNALDPSGELVLSGLLLEQADGVCAAYEKHGLALRSRVDEGEWTALALGRPITRAR